MRRDVLPPLKKGGERSFLKGMRFKDIASRVSDTNATIQWKGVREHPTRDVCASTIEKFLKFYISFRVMESRETYPLNRKKIPRELRRLYTLKIARDVFEFRPRIPYVKLHHLVKKRIGIRMRDTTERYIKEGFEERIIRPPRPILNYHQNNHQHIDFIDGNILDLENIVKEEKGIRYACALSGSSEKIMITSFSSRGRDLFFLGYSRADGFNRSEDRCLKSLEFPPDEEPIPIYVASPVLQWDETDWSLFHILSPDMRIPYATISNEKGIDLGWRAIKNRFEKRIFPACTIAAYLFPRGQSNYQQLFLQFKTEYQKNFYDKLNNLQSTSYFMYFEKKEIGVFVFPENMNKVVKLFKKMEIEGIIEDFQYFLPLEWFHCDLGRPWASSASST